MPALKDVGRIAGLLGVSPLSTSPLWSRAVDKINTHAIYAFIAQMSGDGKRDQAETAISIAISFQNHKWSITTRQSVST